MDWSWFFSALAQSTAAIVGLVGAFVFTRIVHNESEFNRKDDDLVRLRERAHDLENRTDILGIKKYNRSRRSSCLRAVKSRVKDKLKKDESPPPPEYYALVLNFSIYDDISAVVEAISEAIKEAAEELKEEEKRRGTIGSLASLGTSPVQKVDISSIWEQQTRRSLDDLRADVERHTATVARALTEARQNPQYSPNLNRIIYGLLAIFFVGVVYPLGNLPAVEGAGIEFSPDVILGRILSFQTVLLTILTTLFVMGARYLRTINEGLKHTQSRLSELESYTDVAGYSRFLTNPGRWEEWKTDNYEELRVLSEGG